MSHQILKKCLEELGQAEPKLDYVRGMLEAVLEMQSGSTPIDSSVTFPRLGAAGGAGTVGSVPPMLVGSGSTSEQVDEGTLMTTMAAAKVAEVARLASQGLE